MVAVTERKQRPELPPVSELPGGAFSDWDAYLALMNACWAHEPEDRPTFEQVRRGVRVSPMHLASLVRDP